MLPTLFAGLALLAAAPALKDPPPKSAAIEGEWTIETALVGGKPDEAIQLNPIDKIVITSNRWTVIGGGKPTYETSFRLDPRQNPAQLDFGSPGQDGVTTGAIFKLNGDSLVICYVLEGERPAKFECPSGSSVRMITLKRLKK